MADTDTGGMNAVSQQHVSPSTQKLLREDLLLDNHGDMISRQRAGRCLFGRKKAFVLLLISPPFGPCIMHFTPPVGAESIGTLRAAQSKM